MLTIKEEDQIYEALKILIDNPQKRFELGSISYNYAKENLDIRQATHDYLQFIDGIAKEKLILESLTMKVSELLMELELDHNEQLIQRCATCFPFD